jgi:hypothetical protein
MTHLTASYLLKKAVSPRHNVVPFLLGATLPDLLAYMPLILTGFLPLQSMPLWVNASPYLFFPFHGIVAFTVFSLMLALMFPIERRKGVFINLELGGVLHMFMDLLQVQHGGESGYLLFPFSRKSFALEWIETESSLYTLPFLVAAATIVVGVEWIRHRNESRQLEGPGADPSA